MKLAGTWLLCWNKMSVLVDDIRSLMVIWMLINAVLMDVPPCLVWSDQDNDLNRFEFT